MINTIFFNTILNKLPKSPTKFKFLSKRDNLNNLNNFINDIFIKLDIPRSNFLYSLYYLFKFVEMNSNNLDLFANDKKLYIFSSIILNFKFINDINYNIKYICELFKINYIQYCKTEIIILYNLNWNLIINDEELNMFKKWMEHHKDLYHILRFPY